MEKEKEVLVSLSQYLIEVDKLTKDFIGENYAGRIHIKRAIDDIQREIEVLLKIENVADKTNTKKTKGGNGE